MKIYLVMRDSGDGARLGVPVKAFDDEISAKSYQRDCQEWETKVGQFRQEFWVTSVGLDCRLVSGRGGLTCKSHISYLCEKYARDDGPKTRRLLCRIIV